MNLPINKILNGDALTHLKELPNESINCVMTSPPFWALRDYGSSVETIWDEDKNCDHEWKISDVAGNIRFRPGHNTSVGNNKNPLINNRNGLSSGVVSKRNQEWVRPSRQEFANRTVRNVCPVCNKEFEKKPNQKFCSIICLNTLSNEERTNTPQLSNFCQKCNAWKGQLGLEPTFELYINHLCNIFDEIKRVLRKDGTCWVNLGDTYYGGNKDNEYVTSEVQLGNKGSKIVQGTKFKEAKELPTKSLCMIPFRFAIEMVNRSWILRNTIIWHKPNCMPSSVKDRFTVDFEYLFFFVKNKKYFFETQYETPISNNPSPITFKSNRLKSPYDRRTVGQNKQVEINPFGRNKRAVWKIPTQPFPEAHFATYPEALCEIPIKSGCPEFVCNKCGKTRESIIEPTEDYKNLLEENKINGINQIDFFPRVDNKNLPHGRKSGFEKRVTASYENKGYTDCGCNDYYCSNCEMFINLQNIELCAIQRQREKENLHSELGEKSIQENERTGSKIIGDNIFQRKRLLDVWKEILRKEDASMLFKKLWSKMASQEGESQYLESKERQESSLEGGETKDQRIYLSMESKSSEVNKRWIYDGTQDNNGEISKKSIREERECSSQEWDKDRQQNREFGSSGLQQPLWRSCLSSLSKEFQSEIKCPFCFSKDIILKSSDFSGGIILDPFFGAGTTGLVAIKQNKNFIGIELNENYISIAKKRLEPYLEQQRLI